MPNASRQETAIQAFGKALEPLFRHPLQMSRATLSVDSRHIRQGAPRPSHAEELSSSVRRRRPGYLRTDAQTASPALPLAAASGCYSNDPNCLKSFVVSDGTVKLFILALS